MNFKQIIFGIISTNGSPSSKRIVTLLAFVLMGIGFISNLFWDYDIEQFIYESMMWIVLGGLGFTASEKFVKLTPKTPPTDETKE